MGLLGKIGGALSGAVSGAVSSAVGAVGKVAEVATGGAIGKMIAGTLERFGLPKEICGIVACIGDPSYSTKFLADELDRVGKLLHLPDKLTGGLKKLLQNADKYALAFAKGGFGEVICEVGKDLGLPPKLCTAIAAGVDAWSGNAAGAAEKLMRLAGDAARHLGVPESAVNIVKFAGAAYSGDVKGMTKLGMAAAVDVVDSTSLVPDEMRAMMQMAVASYSGDDKAAKEHLFTLASQVAGKIGLPAALDSTFKVAVAYAQNDQNALQAGLKELGNDLVGRLPPEIQKPARMAVEQFAKDPANAMEALRNLPDTAKEGFELLTAAAKTPENLRKAASLGIQRLPPELQAAVRDTVNAYIQDPKAAMDSLQMLPAQAREEFFTLLDNATDPERVRDASRTYLEKAVGAMPLETRRAYDLALHLATDDSKALKEDLDKFTADVRLKLPPNAQEALTLVGQIADGDTTALRRELDKVKGQLMRELADKYQPPMRA